MYSSHLQRKLEALLPKLFDPEASLLYSVHQLISFFAAVDNVDTLEPEGLYAPDVLREALRCAYHHINSCIEVHKPTAEQHA